jgi:hypothetical protein
MRYLPFPTYNPRRDAKWQDVQYRRLPFTDPAIDRYCEAVKSIYANGAARYAAYEATNADDFYSAYQFDHVGWMRSPIEYLLGSELVLAEFAGESPGGERFDGLEIVRQGGCQFEGLLADTLLGGGAYHGWTGTVDEAKTLASDCVTGLRTLAPEGQPWASMLVAGHWCSFFHDICWDYTFVVQFPYHCRWFVLCATDTD